MCDYDSNIATAAVNKSAWVPRFRFTASYDMMGDMDGVEWAHLVLGHAVETGKILDYEVFCSLTGYFGLKNVTFSFDVDVPGVEGFMGMLEVGTGIANEIVGDSDAKAHGVGLLNPPLNEPQDPLADWEKNLAEGKDLDAERIQASDEALDALRRKLTTPIDAWDGCPKRCGVCTPVCSTKVDVTTNSEVIIPDVSADRVLCYDDWSGRYFHSTMKDIALAVGVFNQIILDEGEGDLNTFYDRLELSPIPMGTRFGWQEPIDLMYSSIIASNGVPAIAVSFRQEPKHDFFRN